MVETEVMLSGDMTEYGKQRVKESFFVFCFFKMLFIYLFIYLERDISPMGGTEGERDRHNLKQIPCLAQNPKGGSVS